jgi:hypothetical protein
MIHPTVKERDLACWMAQIFFLTGGSMALLNFYHLARPAGGSKAFPPANSLAEARRRSGLKGK